MFIYFILAVLIVLLDQLTKYFLTLQLSGGAVMELLPGLVRMEYLRNTGAALSLLSNMRWLLVGVSAVVIVALIIGMLKYKTRIDWVGKLGLAAILGGAFSNLIDRVVFGYVADFFEFEFVRFAVFNVADIFITVGGVVFCLWYLLRGSKQGGLREELLLGKKKTASNVTGDTQAQDSDPEDGSDSHHS